MEDGTIRNAMEFDVKDFYFNFTLLIEGMEVKFNVTEAHLQELGTSRCPFGNLDPKNITQLINLGYDLGIPYFNNWV